MRILTVAAQICSSVVSTRRVCAGPTSLVRTVGSVARSCTRRCLIWANSRCCRMTAAIRSTFVPTRCRACSGLLHGCAISWSPTSLGMSTTRPASCLPPPTLRSSSSPQRYARWLLPLGSPPRSPRWSTTCESWSRGPAPGGLAALDVAHALGLPLAGYLKAESNLGARLERGEAPAGEGRGPLAQFCRELLASLTFPNDPVRDVVADVNVDWVAAASSVRTVGWRPTVAP